MTSIKPADIRSIWFVRRIRNLPTNRQWFMNTDEVGRIEHLRWWASCRRRAQWLYVVEHDGRHAGYVRLQRVTAGTVEVSIALHPSFQGLGVGREALDMAIRETSAQLPCDVRWEATVRKDNQASINMFSAGGFVVDMKSTGGHKHFITMALITT